MVGLDGPPRTTPGDCQAVRSRVTAGLKIKAVDKISTAIRIIAPPGAGDALLVVKAASPTPLEVGEEEITAHLQSVFLASL